MKFKFLFLLSIIVFNTNTQNAYAGSLGGSLSTGWSLAEKYFDMPEEIRALDETFDFNAILSDPEGSWDSILQKGADYAITEGPTELQTIDEIIDIGGILADPENGFDTALNNAAAYLLNVLGGQVGNDCPEIMRFVPGECPSGGYEDLAESDDGSDDGENDGGITSIPSLVSSELPKTSAGLREISSPNDDVFSSNPTVIKRDLANLYDQEYARAQAARFLGTPGQKWLDMNFSAVTSLVQQNLKLATEIGALASQSQKLDVTQDVMKAQATMNSRLANLALNQSQISAQMQASLLSVQQQQASLMQQSANVGEALDEGNRRERLERDTLYLDAGRSAIYLPGFDWSPK